MEEDMKWNQILPEFDVFNLDDTLKFYVNLIGFKVKYERKEDKFAFLELEDIQIMIQEINPKENKWQTGELEYPLGRGINFEFDLSDIDIIYNRLVENNYKIFVPLQEHWYRKDDMFLGAREFLVQDPNGYALRFSEELENKPIENKMD